MSRAESTMRAVRATRERWYSSKALWKSLSQTRSASPSVTASSIAMHAPCARYCSVGCAASPSSVVRPWLHIAIGSRSAVAQRVQSLERSMSWRAFGQMPSK